MQHTRVANFETNWVHAVVRNHFDNLNHFVRPRGCLQGDGLSDPFQTEKRSGGKKSHSEIKSSDRNTLDVGWSNPDSIQEY